MKGGDGGYEKSGARSNGAGRRMYDREHVNAAPNLFIDGSAT